MTSCVADLRAELTRRFVTVEETISFGGHEFILLRPRNADDLIREEDYVQDERLPYWADMWPSSTILAEWLLERNVSPTDVVELGCGIGLVTSAALRAGHDVLATDYYLDALAFTRLNSLVNADREPRTQHLNWRMLPEDQPRASLVIASDVLYEKDHAVVVAESLSRLVGPGGVAVIADPGRVAAPDFLEECARRGIVVSHREDRPYSSGEVRQTVTLYSLSRSASSSRAFTSNPQR